jgi:hypothetical protein
MQHPGWTLVVIGVVIAGIGLAWLLAPAIPWLGKLPGTFPSFNQLGPFPNVRFPIIVILPCWKRGISWVQPDG